MVQVATDLQGHRSFLPPRPSKGWYPVSTPSPPSIAKFPSANLNSTETAFNFSSNSYDIFSEHQHYQVLDSRWQALVITGYVTLITVGVVSNVLVCCVVIRQSSHRAAQFGGRSRNFYILNLALADLALCCICMPLTLHSLLHFHWSMGLLICKLAPVVQGTFD